MGAAAIAHEFVGGVQKHTKQQIVAVASRTPGKAQEFAATFGLESHDNYEDLLARTDIDAIYIPTLPSQHKDHALQAIAAGKHVLIEKPLTLNVAEVEEIFAASKAAGVLAMEAMWSRYIPQYDIARQLLENGSLGEIQMMNIAFCSDNRLMPRLWKKGMGSPVIDMGIYSISLAQMFLGEPESITAQGQLNANGIDEEVSIQLHYANGARAYILSSGIATLPVVAAIAGSKGHLSMGQPFFVPSQINFSDSNDFYFGTETWKDETGVEGHAGLSYQATAFAKYVSEGLLESPLESHEQSVANIRTALKVVELIGAEIV